MSNENGTIAVALEAYVREEGRANGCWVTIKVEGPITSPRASIVSAGPDCPFDSILSITGNVITVKKRNGKTAAYFIGSAFITLLDHHDRVTNPPA